MKSIGFKLEEEKSREVGRRRREMAGAFTEMM